MSHTPSHIDNTGGGMLMNGDTASSTSTLQIGVLTPFVTYNKTVFDKHGAAVDEYLDYDASVPYVTDQKFDPGDHVGFRLQVVGTEDCQFALAVDLFRITNDVWDKVEKDVQNQSAIDSRLKAIKDTKMFKDPNKTNRSPRIAARKANQNEIKDAQQIQTQIQAVWASMKKTKPF